MRRLVFILVVGPAFAGVVVMASTQEDAIFDVNISRLRANQISTIGAQVLSRQAIAPAIPPAKTQGLAFLMSRAKTISLPD